MTAKYLDLARVVVTCGFALAGGATCAEAASMKARWAADFVDSVGVNTHFADAGSGYRERTDALLEHLRSAHIRHLRDAAIADAGRLFSRDGSDIFRRIGAAGLRINFLVDRGASAEFVRRFPARVAPSLESFELPNEANAGSQLWAPPLREWVYRFHKLVAENAPGTPIVGPSLMVLSLDNPYAELGDISGDVAFGNVHDYTSTRPPGTTGWGGPGQPPCGDTRYGSMAFAACYARAASGQRPLMATETGWPTGIGVPEHVSEETQATYVMQTVLAHFAAGFARTYVYQLMDAGADGGATMGLLRADASPKPAMTALATLLRQLDDAGASSTGGVGPSDPGAADILLASGGNPAGERDLSHVLLRHRDGRFTLAIWRSDGAADERQPADIEIAGLLASPTACEVAGDTCTSVPARQGERGRLTVAVGARPLLMEFRLPGR